MANVGLILKKPFGINRILILLLVVLPFRSLTAVTPNRSIELVPKITVRGEFGTMQRVE